MILYVQKNEETSCVKMVYFSDGEGGIPSELKANAKSTFPLLHKESLLVSLSQFSTQRFLKSRSISYVPWSIPTNADTQSSF